MIQVPSSIFVDFQQPYSDNLERIGSFCLKPIRLLYGQNYKVKMGIDGVEEATLLTWDKAHRVAVFILSAIIFPLIVGLTAIGIGATYGSTTHQVAYRIFKGLATPSTFEERSLPLEQRIEKRKAESLLETLAGWKDKLRATDLTEHERGQIQKSLLHHLETFPLSTLPAQGIMELMKLCYLYDVVTKKGLNITLDQMASIRSHIETLKGSEGVYQLASVALLAQLGGNSKANQTLIRSFTTANQTALMGCVWNLAQASITKEREGNNYAIAASVWMFDSFDDFEKNFPTWSLSNSRVVEELLNQVDGIRLDWLLRSRPTLDDHPVWGKIKGEQLEHLFSLSSHKLVPLFAGHKSKEANLLLFSKFREHAQLSQVLAFFKTMDWKRHWKDITLEEKLSSIHAAPIQKVMDMFYAGFHSILEGAALGAPCEDWHDLERLLLIIPETDIPYAIKGALKALQEKFKASVDINQIEKDLLIDIFDEASPEMRRNILSQLRELIASK